MLVPRGIALLLLVIVLARPTHRLETQELPFASLDQHEGAATDNGLAVLRLVLVGLRLLAGTLRAELVASGEVKERILSKQDAARFEAVFLINSLRKWVQVLLINSHRV